MRWECGAPLWAWCCCVPGTNCGGRWRATRRWRWEELDERNGERENEAFGRNDTPAVHREAAGSRSGPGSFRTHTRMRHVPYAAAGAGARIAPADTRDARRRRTLALAARAVSGTCPQVDAMDLGIGFWTGGDGRLCALYGIYPALAAATGTSGIWRVKFVGAADFSGRNVERMAVDDDTPRSAGDGY